MTDLTAICDGCHRPVLDGTGWLGVRYSDIHRHRHERADWDAAHPGAQTVADLMAMPEDITWHVYHDRCDPLPAEDAYQIDIERIRSWHALAHWTSHLMAKNWLRDSDWDELLQELADDKGTRLVAIKARAA
jgi:hypothetical protein